ncbi:MAG: 16S rRNA (guanine(527)-N(7))-methyltransferase RsmG [Clostridia bacterium]|nr:16S rRNA (guanine(527)-N(7))-methyltransferase RsmG [Clostridia bacterium]
MSQLTLQEFSTLFRDAVSPDLPGFDAIYPVVTGESCVNALYAVTDKLIDNAKKFNLTSILEPTEIIRKHLIDSLIPLGLLQNAGISFSTALDVGTGAGFPLLPMACAANGVSFTGMDATAKKISHIRETAEFAALANVSAVSGRAEELARGEMRQSFDLVCARAVAALPVLIELCAPFVRVGGHFCALKSHIEEELEPADRAGKLLGLTNIAVIDYEIPGGDTRCLVLYRKTAPTPAKYPRRYAEITKRALG